METLFDIIKTHWVWAGPTLLLILLVMLVKVFKDLFTT